MNIDRFDRYRIPPAALLALVVTTAALPVAADIVDCGDVIDTRVIVTGGTVTTGPCSTNPALTVRDGASLDLNGHTIQCVTSVHSAGIQVLGRGNRIANGSIRGCRREGIVVRGEGGNRFEDLVIADGLSTGIQSENATGNTLRRVRLIGNFEGAHLAGGSVVVDSIAQGNGSWGFRLTGDGGNKLVNNIASGNQQAIAVLGGGNDLRVNIAEENVEYGISAWGDDAKLKGNTASHNDGWGISVSGAGASLLANDSIGNAGNGFEIRSGDAKVLKNKAIHNGSAGFSVRNAQVKFSRNVAVGNSQEGVGWSNSGGKVTSNVAATNGSDGFSVDAAGASFSKNVTDANQGFGIDADGDGLELKANSARANGNGGLRIRLGATNVDVAKSVAFGNARIDTNAFDLDDENAGCGSNVWTSNFLGGKEESASGVTAVDACIR